MQTREKIILGLTGVALIYFVIDVLAISESDIADDPSKMSTECDQFLVRGKDTLNALKSSPELFRRISLLEGRAELRNPFNRSWLQSETASADVDPDDAPRRRIRYTGYFESASMCMVVINENEYSLNEMVEGTDLLIKEISREQVILEPQSLTPEGAEAPELITVVKEGQEYVFNP